jgi:membrane AbrB-like protein
VDARAEASQTGAATAAAPLSRVSPRWRALRIALTLAAAAVGGYLAWRIGMPLPWMLGPFFVCGAGAALGFNVDYLPMGRELGQVAVGLAVGMRFTPPVLAATLALMPHMAVATLYVIAFTMVAALLFAWLAAVDYRTAFFATAAGGMADMAVVAQERGADAGAVSITHAIRVATVVSTVPFLVFALGEPGNVPEARDMASHNLLLVALGLLLAYGGARLFKFTPFPNPWLVGPIFIGALLGATGILIVHVPWSLIVVAQILIGVFLGCRFRREVLVKLPRVALAGLCVSLLMVAAAAAGAVVLTMASDLDFMTSFLALAPAAVTEMVITAQAMHIDPATVTAFHVMRIAVISSTVLAVFALFRKALELVHGTRI